jgi:hypothetical protein
VEIWRWRRGGLARLTAALGPALAPIAHDRSCRTWVTLSLFGQIIIRIPAWRDRMRLITDCDGNNTYGADRGPGKM